MEGTSNIRTFTAQIVSGKASYLTAGLLSVQVTPLGSHYR